MAVYQRSGKVKTLGSSPIVLSLPSNIDPAHSLIVVVSSYSGVGAQSFSGSCGGTALAVATDGNHPNGVGALAVLYLVDPPSGQNSVSVSSVGNAGYYTAALIEVPKLASAAPVNALSAITTTFIAAAGGTVDLAPSAGTTTAANAVVVTGWATAGATATTVGSASPPSGYTLEFSEDDDVNAQCGAAASQFLTATQAVAPSWAITASAGASQQTHLVGSTVVFALANASAPPPDLSLSLSNIEPPDVLVMAAVVEAAPSVAWRFDSTGLTLDDTALLRFDSALAAPALNTLSAALVEAYDVLSMACTVQSGGPINPVISVDHAYKLWHGAGWVPTNISVTVAAGESVLVLCAGWNSQGASMVPSMTGPGLTAILDQGANYGSYGYPVYCQAYAAFALSAGTYIVSPPGYSTSADDGDMWVIRLAAGCSLRAGSAAQMHDEGTGFVSATLALGNGAQVGDAAIGICVTDNWTITPTLAVVEQTGWTNLGRQTNGQESAINSIDWRAVSAANQSAMWQWADYDCRVRSAVMFALQVPQTSSGGQTLDADLLSPADALTLTATTAAGLSAAVTEARDAAAPALSAAALAAYAQAEPPDAPTAQASAALAAAYAQTETADTVAAQLLVQASAVLSISLAEAADALGASAATLTAAQALALEPPDALAGQASAALGMAASLGEAADALAAQLQAALGAAYAQTAPPDALTARLVPIVQGAMYAELQEPPDLLALAATAQSLAGAVLAEHDALAAQAALASAASATLAEAADATAADLATEATAHMAIAVIEAPDSLTAAARGAVLASAVLLETDALQSAATALAAAAFEQIESPNALAMLLAQQPVFANLDPRYVAQLAARSFLAVRTARSFLAVRTARSFLAILRMGTTMTDTLEDKDPAEPAEITFSFDEALAPGTTLTGAAVIAVQPLGGIDPDAATWAAALAAVVGAVDGVVGGRTVPAGRYATVVVPAGAGLNGLRYLIAVQGHTPDPDVAPVCKALLPIVR